MFFARYRGVRVFKKFSIGLISDDFTQLLLRERILTVLALFEIYFV